MSYRINHVTDTRDNLRIAGDFNTIIRVYGIQIQCTVVQIGEDLIEGCGKKTAYKVSGLIACHGNMLSSERCTLVDIDCRGTVQSSDCKGCVVVGTGTQAKVVGIAFTQNFVFQCSARQIDF